MTFPDWLLLLSRCPIHLPDGRTILGVSPSQRETVCIEQDGNWQWLPVSSCDILLKEKLSEYCNCPEGA